MYCPHCGAALSESASFCRACGGEQIRQDIAAPAYTNRHLAGFSPKISDPAFSKYVKNANRWAAIFSIILAIAAVIGFYIAGEIGSEMDNPQSLYIGFGIGGMFFGDRDVSDIRQKTQYDLGRYSRGQEEQKENQTIRLWQG